jgi:hypothetical protein
MSNQQEQDKLYKAYEGEHDQLCATNLEVSARFDHWVLTLSGGAIGVSLAFLKDLAPEPAANTTFLPGLAWVFLVLSLLAGFSSLLTAQHGALKAIAIAGLEYKARKAGVDRGEDPQTISIEVKNIMNLVTLVLNWVATVGFILGTAFLCCFAYSNLKPAAITRAPYGSTIAGGVAPTVVTNVHTNMITR